MLSDSFLEQIKEFFFKAMLAGWAGDTQKIMLPNMPKYKGIPFGQGDFYLFDCYCVTSQSAKSAGMTTIWHKEDPVWIMHYGGYYEKGAIRFLKRALLVNYEQRIFIGGRGPARFHEGFYSYYNRITQNDFNKFSGQEEIISRHSGEVLGYHDYWGMSLI